LKLAPRIALFLAVASALAAVATSPGYLLDAVESQRKLSVQNPGNTQILNDLANLLVMAGDLPGAQETYRRALDLAPGDTSIRYNLALALMESAQNQEATDHLQSIIEQEPSHAWAHYQLGTLYANKNYRMRALRHYERAFALDWDLISPRINPHIVENNLATDAMLRAYMSQSPAITAPRLFQQPDSVADLLVPPRTEPVRSDEELLEASANQPTKYKATYSSDDGSESGNSVEEDRVLTESDLEGSSVPPTSTAQKKKRRRPRSTNSQNSSTYIEPPADPVSTSQPVQREPTRSPTRQQGVQSGTGATDFGSQSVSPGAGTFFQPGTSSTGRLDLELLPGTPTKPLNTPT